MVCSNQPTEDGRSPQAGRATLASHQAPAGLGHAEGIPNADDWWCLILDAYDAGVQRGKDEATAFEWGSSTSSKYYDELIDAVHERMNEGRDWRAGDIVTWDLAAAVVAQAIEARKGGDAKQAPSQDESAVGNADAPTPTEEQSQ